MPDFVGLDKKSAQKLADKANIKVRFIGFGVVKQQLPRKGEPLNSSIQAKLIFKAPSYD